MYDPLKKLGKVGDYLATGDAAAQRIYELIDAPLSVQEPSDPTPFPKPVKRGVEFKTSISPIRTISFSESST